jgi:hypothetical protein
MFASIRNEGTNNFTSEDSRLLTRLGIIPLSTMTLIICLPMPEWKKIAQQQSAKTS